jgi:hypothetical protein
VSGKNRAVSLKNDLNQISPSSVAETNLKTILGIQLDYLIGSQIKLDSAQIVAISAIASQCRYDGGWAVILARQLIPGEYVDDLLCASHSRDAEFNNQLNKDILVEVYPNPSSGLLNINLKNSSSFIICQIYKFDGTMVKSWVTDQVNQSIDISNFSDGVYLLSVSGKGIQTSTTTFILNH